MGFWYLQLCHNSKKEIVILKLDFEKAFDRVEHEAMLTIMKHKGFGTILLGWMQNIFNSETSSILLNGVAGKGFIAEEEWDKETLPPLSPLCSSSWSIAIPPEWCQETRTFTTANSPYLQSGFPNFVVCRWHTHHNGRLPLSAANSQGYSSIIFPLHSPKSKLL